MGARAWVIAGGAIALAVAIVVLVGPRARTGVSGAPELESTPSTPSPPIERSAVAVPAAPTPSVAVVAPASAEPEQTAAPLPTAPVVAPAAEMLAANGKDVPSPVQRSEQDFLVESVDAAWAPGAETEILGKLAQHTGLGLLSLQVECRTTLCRVQITKPQPPDEVVRPLDFLTTLGLQPRLILARGAQPGTLSAVAYLQRPGTGPSINQ
jgi:hypothetical protein